MLRFPHNRKARIQFALVIAFVAAFFFGARWIAEWLRSDEYFLEFEYAIQRGDVDEVRRLLESGVSPNVGSTVTGQVPLHVAVRENNRAMVYLLLDYGADPNKADSGPHETPLLTAMKRESITADILLERGARVDVADDRNVSPLHLAVQRGDMALVRRLVKMGAPLHVATEHDYGQETPAYWALDYGHPEIAAYILFDGGKGEFSDERLDLLLLKAISARSADLVRQLIDAGADPNERDPDFGAPIEIALLHGIVDCTRVLLEHGAVVEGKFWWFARYLARPLNEFEQKLSDKPALLDLLIEHGADINEVDFEGETALHIVAEAGKADAIRLLINHGADVNARTPHGATPLHFAASMGWVEAVETLLELGVDPAITNDFGETAAQVAQRSSIEPSQFDPRLDASAEIADREKVVDVLHQYLHENDGDRE